MQDFPANSAKARARSEGPPQDERPRVERVTSAEAVLRKKGLGSRFKDTFIGGSARGALDYMIVEVVIPEIQDMMINAFQGGVERLIRGEHRPRRSGGSAYSTNPPRVNYQGMSTNSAPPTRTISRQSRTRHDFGEIVFQSRRDAEEVLERLYDVLSRFGEVPVADLYELTGIQSGHTDTKWGWTSLRGGRIDTLRNGRGYSLNLPSPEPLER